jgi:hypothetical protein
MKPPANTSKRPPTASMTMPVIAPPLRFEELRVVAPSTIFEDEAAVSVVDVVNDVGNLSEGSGVGGADARASLPEL